MSRKIIIEIISALFIILFCYASLSKLANYNRFVSQIGQSPMLALYAEWVAVTIPVVELLICALLMTDRWRLIGMYNAFGLMVLFSLYIFVILNLDKALPCSCGGVLNSLGWRSHLVFNLVFVGLGLAGILLISKDKVSIKHKVL